jgi:Domain of unknown function (DUF4157)
VYHVDVAQKANTLQQKASSTVEPTGLLYIQSVAGNQAAQSLMTDDEAVANATRGSGSPLTADVRVQMESVLGADFGSVRVHHDDASTRQLGAHAYTTGDNIVFAAGQYNPTSPSGLGTLAHELTHVVQQRQGPVDGTDSGGGVKLSDPGDRFEREAYAVGDAVASGNAVQTIAVQRSYDRHVCDSGCNHSMQRMAVEPAVQRHASWEHALLGNTTPKNLAGAVGKAKENEKERGHVLESFMDQLGMFAKSAWASNPQSIFPDTLWINLSGSGLWISYGELNALADYLPGPGTIDSQPASMILPIVQRMREQMYEACIHEGQVNKKKLEFSGAAQHITETRGAAIGAATVVGGPLGGAGAALKTSPGQSFNNPVSETLAIDDLTKSLGENKFSSLLARNACHFAPDSWQRWLLFHNSAREQAVLAYNKRQEMREKTIPSAVTASETHTEFRLAWLYNGYGDHFLEDSFAAGHLVNKTWIMQWFADWFQSNRTKLGDEMPIIGGRRPSLPPDRVLDDMGWSDQPNIAGQEFYGYAAGSGRTAADHKQPKLPRTTKWQDRVAKTGVTEPEANEGRDSKPGRMAGTGLRLTGSEAANNATYETYLDFLDSSLLQLASGFLHDHFNKLGLEVKNGMNDVMHIGGDDTMFSESNDLGLTRAAEAAEMSRNVIKHTIEHGKPNVTTEAIFAHVPIEIVVDGKALPLQEWNMTTLKRLCESKLFWDYWKTLKSYGAAASPTATGGRVSKDQH